MWMKVIRNISNLSLMVNFISLHASLTDCALAPENSLRYSNPLSPPPPPPTTTTTLREAGHILGAYIDDIFNMGMTSKECQNNLLATVHLLNSLGFNIHPDKSKFTPSQVLVFLGFVINSVWMKVSLTAERKVKIKEACANLLNNEPHTIRIVAKVIGLMTASFPGVKFGRLHFRDLERCKRLSC